MRDSKVFGLLAAPAFLFSCATGELHPCVKGGDPARERLTTSAGAEINIGTRQCEQRKLTGGTYLNDGRYREWYPGGRLLLQGEYKLGKKSGKWIEWDQEGKQISERWFEDGKEAPTREQTTPMKSAAE